MGALSSPTAAVLMFSAASASLLLINKACLHFFHAPSFMSTLQFVFAALTSIILMLTETVPLDRYDWARVKPYLLYITLFVCTIYCNMKALEHSNVETVIVFRACCPLVVCMLDWAFMGRQLPSARSAVSLVLLVAGAVSYVRSDRDFRLRGYAAYSWCLLLPHVIPMHPHRARPPTTCFLIAHVKNYSEGHATTNTPLCAQGTRLLLHHLHRDGLRQEDRCAVRTTHRGHSFTPSTTPRSRASSPFVRTR